MAGFIAGAILISVGVGMVFLGRRQRSAWMQRLGWGVFVIAAIYLFVGAMVAFGPDLTQD